MLRRRTWHGIRDRALVAARLRAERTIAQRLTKLNLYHVIDRAVVGRNPGAPRSQLKRDCSIRMERKVDFGLLRTVKKEAKQARDRVNSMAIARTTLSGKVLKLYVKQTLKLNELCRRKMRRSL